MTESRISGGHQAVENVPPKGSCRRSRRTLSRRYCYRSNVDEALSEVRETRLLINRVDEWLYDEIEPYLGQRVLEVGCGLGNLLRYFYDKELFVGIDPDQETIETARVSYSHCSNVELYPLSILSSDVLDLQGYNFDTVISLNVFEHIKQDMSALEKVRYLLKPGGNLVLIVPAHSWLYGSMDKSIGHYRRYDKQTMLYKLEKVGFEIVTQSYLNVLGALGWFVNGRILRRQTPPQGQLRLFNLLVPLLRRIEGVCPPPIGISLLTVAR